MYILLCISLLLVTFLTFNSLASLGTAASWTVVAGYGARWPASVRARLLFLLRVLPPLAGLIGIALLLIPAYLVHEPRATSESVSFKMALIALASAVGIMLAVLRGIAASRATARLVRDWLAAAERIKIDEVDIPTFRIRHPFPVIAIVGVIRPRLFVANHILDSLTSAELAAAIAHETGHLAVRDNLKRGLLRACRDALLIIPCGRSLDRAWAEAAEIAADEYAARGGPNIALDLAATLVKIARMIPKGARPMMPAGAFLLGGDEPGGVKIRVRRLLELAAMDQRSNGGKLVGPRSLTWPLLVSICFLCILVASNNQVLTTVHSMIEHLVFFLR
ncbi:MAG TPA: M48 family metalloprotease [Pyrinomonadaceae bacterium]|jgi:Zn-dependent protease with chaperone function